MSHGPLLVDPDNGGAIGRAMRWAFGRSWRTTVLGLLSMAGTVVTAVAAMQDAPHALLRWAPVLAQATMSLGLMLTKDSKITGVDRPPELGDGADEPKTPPPAVVP